MPGTSGIYTYDRQTAGTVCRRLFSELRQALNYPEIPVLRNIHEAEQDIMATMGVSVGSPLSTARENFQPHDLVEAEKNRKEAQRSSTAPK